MVLKMPTKVLSRGLEMAKLVFRKNLGFNMLFTGMAEKNNSIMFGQNLEIPTIVQYGGDTVSSQLIR